MSATLTLDAHYINLHALLHRYFAESGAVFAEVLALTAKEADKLCQDSVDICILSFVSQSLAAADIATASFPPSVIFNADNLATLPTLPLTDTLKQNTELGVHCLMERHKLTKTTAEQLLTLTATLCVHYIARLASDGRLTDEQKRLWLALQTHFLPKNTLTIAQTLGLVLTDINADNYPSFAHDKLKFDNKKLPNWRWLITLALSVQREDSPQLKRGELMNFAPQFDYTPQAPSKKAVDGVWYAWLGVGVVMVGVLGVLGIKETRSSKLSAMPDTSATVQVQKPVVQDVAIVRVDNKDKGEKDKGKQDKANQDKGDKATKADKKPEPNQEANKKQADKKDTDKKSAKPVDKPLVDKPKAEQSKTDKPKTDKPKSDKPNSDKPRTEKPKAEKSKTEQPKSADKPKTDKPTDKPKSDKPKSQYTLALPKDDKSAKKDNAKKDDKPKTDKKGDGNYTLGDYMKGQ